MDGRQISSTTQEERNGKEATSGEEVVEKRHRVLHGAHPIKLAAAHPPFWRAGDSPGRVGGSARGC
jgi:hypothetical protein